MDEKPNRTPRKRMKLPLMEAVFLVDDATQITQSYLRDLGHMPTEEELEQLRQLYEMLWPHQVIAEYIAANMNRRARGEPEQMIMDPPLDA
jgi:cell fate (sporulation/competence/biofilm development) regulator YlbF (YheA/YmcA/DUF963 family)